MTKTADFVILKYTAAALALIAIAAEMTRDLGSTEPAQPVIVAEPAQQHAQQHQDFMELPGLLADEEYGEHTATPIFHTHHKEVAPAKSKPIAVAYRPKQVQKHARLIAQRPKTAPFQPLYKERMTTIASVSSVSHAPDAVPQTRRSLKQKIARFFTNLKSKLRHREPS